MRLAVLVHSLFLAFVVVAGAAGCSFDVDLAGRKCSADHACITGFTCVDGVCLAAEGEAGEGEGDAGEGEAGEGEGDAGEGEGDAGEGEGEGEGETCTVNGDCRNAEVCGPDSVCIADCRLVAGTCTGALVCDDPTGFCRATVCGDGAREGLEECDDGLANSDSTPNACRSDCTLPFCGDLIVDTDFGESCDDNNADDLDGCLTTCVSTFCGDGVVNGGEECDDGALLNSDVEPNACRTTCVAAHCGDGVSDNNEQCDDGVAGRGNGDGCDDNCTPSACGNGVVAPGEICDDGDTIDVTNGCDSNCTPTGCGNGVVTAGEECDEGAALNSDTIGDRCRTDCTAPFCGDGVQDPANGEACDDGNQIDNDDCSNACVSLTCGDGVLNSTEQCDDGGLNSDSIADRCRTSCVNPFCGDHVVDTGEICDDGNRVNGDGCDNNCTPTACGNAVVTAGEQCDDGDTVDVTNGCDGNCTVTACGNGVITAATGESCDDGNRTDGDGCDSNCTSTGCGNGIATSGELCDDGNADDGDACPSTCNTAFCGDGFVHTGVEQCDNAGNNSDTAADACRSDCRVAHCGDTVVDSNETCDDGNTTPGDGCAASCHVTPRICGDGFVQAPNDLGNTETCDDGNAVSGDGCSSLCTIETPTFQCFGHPSVCCRVASGITNVASGSSIQNGVNGTAAGGCVFVAAGTHNGQVIVQKNLTIVGEDVLSTIMTSASDPTLLLNGNAGISTVTVQGFTVKAPSGTAVTVSQKNHATLKGLILENAAGFGLDASGGQASVSLVKSVVALCAGGGLNISNGGGYTIENDVIALNGGAASLVGGVDLQATGTFRHNTVVDNVAASLVPGGVLCGNTITVFGSIVFGNTGVAELGCTMTSSDFEGGTGTNISLDPQLIGGGDFHLRSTSPCIDRITASTTTSDIDNDPRPQGVRFDIGADEFR